MPYEITKAITITSLCILGCTLIKKHQILANALIHTKQEIKQINRDQGLKTKGEKHKVSTCESYIIDKAYSNFFYTSISMLIVFGIIFA